jgi:hypothetical protein
MTTDHRWLEKAALVAEYKACVEHYTALVILNRGSALRGKPVELTEAARLNCEAVRMRLADYERELHGLTAAAATGIPISLQRSGRHPRIRLSSPADLRKDNL